MWSTALSSAGPKHSRQDSCSPELPLGLRKMELGWLDIVLGTETAECCLHTIRFLLTAQLQGKTVLSPVMQKRRIRLREVKGLAQGRSASWRQAVHLKDHATPSECRRSRGGVWGLRPGKGVSHLCQASASSSTAVFRARREYLQSMVRGRVEVVLPQPLFWARPMSGSLSCFLPDSPPVRHGVASLVSHVSVSYHSYT